MTDYFANFHPVFVQIQRFRFSSVTLIFVILFIFRPKCVFCDVCLSGTTIENVFYNFIIKAKQI